MSSLVELSLDKVINNFDQAPFRAKECLSPQVAKDFYNKLPLPSQNVDKIHTLATFVDSDEYWKRACKSKGKGGKVEEHGHCHKRMFFELQLQDLLLSEESLFQETIVERLKPFADCIYILRLSGVRHSFPLDVVTTNLPNLMSIDLKKVSGLKDSIPKAIASSPFLLSLLLTETQLTDADVTLIIENLTQSQTLLHLDLSHNKITSTGVSTICETLVAPADSSILSNLDLSGNNISSEGASVIGQALATNESLISLNLRLNNIGDEDGAILLQGLSKNTTLNHLNMAANKLGSMSVKALLQVLEKRLESEETDCCALESVVLTSNKFAHEDMVLLSQCQCETCFVDVRSTSEPRKPSYEMLASVVPC